MIKIRIVKEDFLDRRISRCVDKMVCGVHPMYCLQNASTLPAVDLLETEDGFVVVVELPGMDPDDTKVVVDRLHLQIKGRRRQPYPEGPLRVHQSEIHCGAFERFFRLPLEVNPDEASAEYESGWLKVYLPKKSLHVTRVMVQP